MGLSRLIALAGAIISFAIFPAFAQAAAPGLVGAYGFDEVAGTAAVDASGSSNGGSLNGPVRVAGGRYGGALSFDGSNDQVTIADADSLDLTTGMTLSAWVNPSQTTGSWRTVMMKEHPVGMSYALYANTDTNQAGGYISTPSESSTKSTSVVPTNTWTHLATTFDGSSLKVYVNGTLASTHAVSGSILTGTGSLRIGGNAVWPEWFKGLIDEVRVYNRAQTAAEIATDMTTPVSPPALAVPSPTDVTASLQPGGKVRVNWTKPSGITSFKVYRSTTPGFAPAAADATATVDTGAGPGLYWEPGYPADGTYYYRVAAVDGSGNVSAASAETSVLVSDNEPSLLIINPRGETGEWYGDGPASIWCSLMVLDRPGTTVTASYRIDGTEYATESATVGSQMGKNIPTAGLSAGMHTLTVVVTDATGHSITRSADFEFRSPGTRTVDITAPVDGATVAGNVNLDATLGNHADWDKVEWSVDGTSIGNGKSDPATVWDSTSVADGTHRVKATVWAYSTVMATDEIQVKVNNVDDVAPSAPGNVQAQVTGQNVTLTWDAATDDVGVTGYRVKRGSTVVRDWGTSRTFTDSALAAGTHSYTVEARDAAGNTTAAPAVDATVTAATPVVTIETPYADAVLSTATVNHDLRATVSGNVGTTTVQFKIDGADYGAAVGYAQGGYSRTLIVGELSNGPHVITAVATDSLGNVGTSAPRNVTVDNPPATTFDLLAPTDGASVSGIVAVDYAWAGGAPDDRLVMRLNGSIIDTGRRKTDPKPTWNTTSLTNGVYTLKFEISRLGSAFMSKTITVTVDNSVATPTPTPTPTATPTATPPATPTPVPGLVAAYGFNESSSTAVTDDSGNGRTGTISGATRNASGKNGGALSFDGTNDSVSVPDANPLDLSTGMTLEAWVKPAALGAMWRTVLIKERPGGLQYALYAGTDNGRASANVFTNDEYEARHTAGLTLNAWSHLAATYDGSMLRLYVNGTQVATRTVAGGAMGNSSGALKIGGNAVWGEWFSGLIDDVRVYNRALSAAEITGDANQAVAGV